MKALSNDQRGRYPRMLKPKKPTPSVVPDKQKTPEELLDEIEYLRAEVAYLKKLQALIQERKSNAQKKKFKS